MKSRNQSLDVLRGVAILLVLGGHVPYFYLWHKIGWAGVDLFFVLSGFLISGLLFREFIETGAINFRRFIIRRGFKIWPALYVYLLVMRLLMAGQPGGVQSGFIESVLFVRNYFPMADRGGYFFDHTWSLAVEEHFYLLLPLLLMALIRLGGGGLRLVPWIFLFTATACLALRFAFHPEQCYATHFRIDELFGGVTLGYLHHFHRERFRTLATNWSLLAAALFLLPMFLLREGELHTWGFASLMIGFALLVAWAVERRAAKVLKPIAWIGVSSYSIYLWQQPVGMGFVKWGADSLLRYSCYLFVAITLGAAMAKAIERPALALRERLFAHSSQLSPQIHAAPSS